MEFDCGWTKPHKWPNVHLFGFSFKLGVMYKVRLPKHRSIEKYLRIYLRNTNCMVPNWNEVTDIDENLRLPFVVLQEGGGPRQPEEV